MRGIKLFGGQYAKPGSIIARQTGTKWHPGKGVDMGRDWTIYSVIEGTVFFDRDGRRINVLPVVAEAEPAQV
jgi:large subunit ribosomal protein L27